MYKNKYTPVILLLILSVIWAVADATTKPNTIISGLSANITATDAITIPKILNFQGKLTNTSGNPVIDSTFSITFRLYTSSSGGSAFWTETQNVQTQNGIFNVQLGSGTSIESIPQSGNCYLEMQVNPNPAMAPRIRLVSSAYAYLSKKSDTANYALSANITYVDSARIATNAHKIQGKDTIALSAKYVDEGQTNSITSGMIIDGTIQRADVTTNFKAPYADTSDYARNIPVVTYVDSTRISTNTHKLQGKDTIALSNKFVDEGQINSISTTMIVDGNVTMPKINQSGATTGQVLKWTGSAWAPRNDSAGGPPSGSAGGDLTGTYPNPTIATGAVNSAKILDGSIRGTDIAKPCSLASASNVLYVNCTGGTLGTSAIWTQGLNGPGVFVKSGLQAGVYVDSTGTNSSGLYINKTTRHGVEINNTTLDGINIKSAGSDGIQIDTTTNYGLFLRKAKKTGLFIANTDSNAIYIDTAKYGYGILINKTLKDGIRVKNAGYAGLMVERANAYGTWIYRAAWDGVNIDSCRNGLVVVDATDIGVNIDSANYGLRVRTAGYTGAQIWSGNISAGDFIASRPSAEAIVAASYGNSTTDTAIYAYGKGLSTGGWSTATDDGDAPCIISSEMTILVSGTAQLDNEQISISYPPIFANNVRSDIPVRITLTPHGNPSGILCVTNKNTKDFKVTLKLVPGWEGDKNISFDWLAIGTLKEPEPTHQAKQEWERLVKEREEQRQSIHKQKMHNNF